MMEKYYLLIEKETLQIINLTTAMFLSTLATL